MNHDATSISGLSLKSIHVIRLNSKCNINVSNKYLKFNTKIKNTLLANVIKVKTI